MGHPSLAAALEVPQAAMSSAGQDGDQGFDSAAEQEVLRLINSERARNGLAPLALDTRMGAVARAHCRLMAEHRSREHQYPGEADLIDRVQASGIPVGRVGENVAMTVRRPSGGEVAAFHGMMMNSPAHRRNILAPEYDSVGIGALWSGGTLYVTEDFIRQAVP